MAKISILGCGWLGLPLARSLVKNNWQVKGSTTSADKLGDLGNQGIEPFLILLSENEIHGDIGGFLSESEILIIDIPPKSGNFPAKIENLIRAIDESAIKKVIFVSSISVYGQTGPITGSTIPIPTSQNGRQLAEAENLFSRRNFAVTILRFGGLVGNDRHPVKHLAGRQNLPNPDAPVNLIHLNDCIGIIASVISKDIWNETLNAVAPFHPSRKTFYTDKAAQFGLPLPAFDDSSLSPGKTVDSQKLVALLNYSFSDDLK